MENSQLDDLEEGFCRWMNGLRQVENLTSNISAEVNDLEMEIMLRNNFQRDLDENFNVDRDDIGIFYKIERDKNTEAYISQLETTLEAIMQKYREHTQSLIHETKMEYNKLHTNVSECPHKDKIEKQGVMINGLVSMMNDFLEEGSSVTNSLLAQNTLLRVENGYLREMLEWPLVVEEESATTKANEEAELDVTAKRLNV